MRGCANMTLFLFLLLFSWVPELLSQDDCKSRWIESNPSLAKRFKGPQLQWFCENQQDWTNKALVEKTTRNDDTMTPAQLDWLNALRGCEEIDCIQKVQCAEGDCKPRQKPQEERPGFKFKPTRVFRMDAIEQQAKKSVQTTLDPSTLQADFLVADSSEKEELATKTVVADLCIKVLASDATPESSFPDAELRPKQLRTKFLAWRAKCTTLQTQTEAFGESLDSVANPQLDLDKVDVSMDTRSDAAKTVGRRRRVATLCQRVLVSKTAQEAYPEYAASNPTADPDDLQRQYALASIKCRHIRSRIDQRSESWDDWVQKGSSESDVVEGMNAELRPPGWQPTTDVDKTSGRRGGTGTGRVKRQTNPNKDQRAVRREIRMLSDEERTALFETFNKLKTEKIGQWSKYDLLTIYHTPDESPGAHWGPAFLPFHRELMKQLEIALRAVNYDVGMVYWDTTLEEGLPDPTHSVIWSNDFFGTKKGEVKEGPFQGWVATHDLSMVPGMRNLYRDVGGSPFGGLYKLDDLDYVLNLNEYEELTAMVDPTFELVHGVVHMFVGGYMADIGISPNDPSFYFHHCFIDYMWEEFRQIKQNRTTRETQYPSNDRSGNNFHYADSQMKPFSIKNKDGLSNKYTDDMFYYEPRPTCSDTVPDCASDYLFCDTKNYRCLSKVITGGNCTGFEGSQICEGGGACSGGKCQAGANPPVTKTTTPGTVVTQPPVVQTTTPDDSPSSTPPPPVTPPVTETTTTTTTTPGSTTTPSVATTTPLTTTPLTTTPIAQEPTTTTPTPTTTTSTSTTTTTTTTAAVQVTTTTASTPTTTTPALQPTPVAVTTTTTTEGPAKQPTPGPHPTAPPIQTTTGALPFKTVYFPITVVRGPSIYQQPVPDCKIISCGKQMPKDYTQVIDGSSASGSTYPHYTGAALVEVRDPETAGRWKTVTFTVEVMDNQGRPCSKECYNSVSNAYGACRSEQVRLSTNSYYSDPITYKCTKEEALQACWAEQDGKRVKKPDYLKFTCM